MYDAKRFTDAGFRHYELYFPDGSCPPDNLTAKFMDIAERESGPQLHLCRPNLVLTAVWASWSVQQAKKASVVSVFKMAATGGVLVNNELARIRLLMQPVAHMITHYPKLMHKAFKRNPYTTTLRADNRT